MGGNTLKLSGRRFGHLRIFGLKDIHKGHSRWNCICDCGKRCAKMAAHLVSKLPNHTTSCGSGCTKITHGQYVGGKATTQIRLLTNAKHRAKKLGIPFTITLNDIHIPNVCPLLHIPLLTGGKRTDSTPTLDRIIPHLGYVRDNIAVISWRANRIKNNASLEELKKIVIGLELLLTEGATGANWSEAH